MAKMTAGKDDSDHLEWLVKCRSQNQHTSLELYKLMSSNTALLKKERMLASFGITLTAASFNLWRAVFLADEEGSADNFDHALGFLRILISDNAIAYTQDKNARAWTCRSYLNNANYRLIGLSEKAPHILANYTVKLSQSPKAVWEHLQKNTDLAVGNYSNALSSKISN